MNSIWLVRIVSCSDETLRKYGWKQGAYLKHRGGLAAVSLEDAAIFVNLTDAVRALDQYASYGLKLEAVQFMEAK